MADEPSPSPPPETVAHDDVCPVCHLLLYAPVKTRCAHLLCASCMAQWADVSTTSNIPHSSLDLDLASFDPDYDPINDLEASCPMCRTPTTASPDDDLARQLELRYPQTYKERRAEEEMSRGQRADQEGLEGVMILVGNRHRLVRAEGTGNKHDWTFFVRISRPDIVDEVRVNLHPTFRPPRLVLRQPPFEVRRLGWGYFTIDAVIVLKEPYVWAGDQSADHPANLKLNWTLDFEGHGRQGRVRAKVRRDELGRESSLAPQNHGTATNWPHIDGEDE